MAVAALTGAFGLAPDARIAATFQRDVVCVLGVPLDVIGMAEAVQRVRERAFRHQPCFISTPNLNFAVSASRDAAFRESLLHSDLCLADGMPLVWIARCLGLPIRERVSGADLFEHLAAHAGPPLRVYLFGGPPGVAAQACERLNREAGGVRCVGFDAAGFGSLDEMSGDVPIQKINRSDAHFVVVALGAQKGQAWIERNRAKLGAPLISHLGAVLNFAAGSLQRAPVFVQRLGLEWLWRIKEQPDLWRRYWNDGSSLIGWFCGRVLPHAVWLRFRSVVKPAPVVATLRVSREPNGSTITLRGDWGREGLGPLREALSAAAADAAPLCIDLKGVTWADSAFVGLMLLARGVFDGDRRLTLREPSPTVRRIFRLSGAGHLLSSGAAV